MTTMAATKTSEGTGWLDTEAVAARAGVSRDTIRVYNTRARRNRAEGNPRPGDLPEPDAHFGAAPVWRPRTIEAWLDSRPGQGAGGGPKPPGTPRHV